MKKLLLSFLSLSTVYTCVTGQDKTQYIKRPALGVHFFFNDFQSAANIRATSLGSALGNHQFGKFKYLQPGLALSYMKGITPHLDFSTTFSGSLLDYPIEGKPAFGKDKFLAELDAMAYLKLLTDKHLFSPYASAGVGMSKYGGYWGAFIPAGIGVQVSFMEEAFLLLNSQYRVKVTDNTNFHFYHSIGIMGNIGKSRTPKVAPPPPPIPVIEVKDRDNDGVPDDVDECPDEAGPKSTNGCPDRDGDGIPDKDDKCPDVPGIARYNGCPIPDRDGDGINDEDDKCPDVPGVARYQGCPVPDRDGDGVNDEDDKCPDIPGPKDNGGCPKMESYNFNAANVQFKSGNAVLLPAAIKELNKAVTILNEHPQLKISIEGHTDASGNDALNQKLSEKRAEAVKAYLVKKGIASDRLSTTGFGASQSIADNKTVKGKAANRRVEFKTMQ